MTAPTCLLIGNFDGVHCGHQALIAQALSVAREEGYTTTVLTFDPHPTHVLAPERAAPLLLTTERKRALLHQYGVDHVVIQPFDIAFSQKSPRAFVQEVITPLNARHIFVGSDFCFGYQRAGTIETLRELGTEFAYVVHAAKLFTLENLPVSSSRVRQALATGDLEQAERLLGRSSAS